MSDRGAVLGDFSGESLKTLYDPWDAPTAGDGRGPRYLISDQLRAAAWVAFLLRQPLLLTGVPGVGKTRFAEKWAYDLKLPLIKVQVKSTTSGDELLYAFDELMRFRDVSIAGARSHGADFAGTMSPAIPLRKYVRLGGIGLAIARGAGPDAEVVPEPGTDMSEAFGQQFSGRSKLTLREIFGDEMGDLEGPAHTLVLIDELDKAPRDTPNDLLAEIENMEFTIRELGIRIRAQPRFKPIVVITSNAERNLPDAFLRRCVYHNIATPTSAEMRMIAAERLGGELKADCALLQSAAEIFDKVSQRSTEKAPGTAEFVAYVACLQRLGAKVGDRIEAGNWRAIEALRAVVKTSLDLESAIAVVSASGRGPSRAG